MDWDHDEAFCCLQGSFQMVELDRNAHAVRHFDAVVAPFRLVAD